MPPTSRLLYYDLGMNADDDGYAEWFTTVRMSGSTEQDLRVLEANGFVRIFDDNVLVILDWQENNYIQKDRYKKGVYIDKYKDFVALDTQCIQNVNKMDTQVRLGKVRQGEREEQKTPPPATLTLLEMMKPFEGALAPKTLNDFYTYWSEPNAKGKERWQAEKFFDVARRLATWKRREEESFSKGSIYQPLLRWYNISTNN